MVVMVRGQFRLTKVLIVRVCSIGGNREANSATLLMMMVFVNIMNGNHDNHEW